MTGTKLGPLVVAPLTACKYEHLAFSSDSPQRKYFGWKNVVVEDGLQIISQQRGLIRRCMILAAGAADERIEQKLALLKLPNATTELILHDFCDAGQEPRRIVGQGWRRSKDCERMLNIATFVFDLTDDDEALKTAMSADYRRKLRRAQEAGVRVLVEDDPSPESFAGFMTSFTAMAREKALTRPGDDVVRKMFDNGDLVLFRAVNGDKTRAVASVYRADHRAIFMIGVGGDRSNDGAGQMLHFEIMRELRSRGVRWYDFGGAPSSTDDGIYRFKKGFGGRFVSLGCEYLLRPPLVGAVIGVRTHYRAATKQLEMFSRRRLSSSH